MSGRCWPDEGLPYRVMEYVEGRQIDRHCDVHKLTFIERLKLSRGVCAAVQYAHQKLVVHGGLDPSNIIVTTGGVAELLRAGYGEPAVEMARTHLRPMPPESRRRPDADLGAGPERHADDDRLTRRSAPANGSGLSSTAETTL